MSIGEDLSAFSLSKFVVARFDFSWGDTEAHRQTLENLRAAVKATKKLCAVCFCFRQ